MTEKELQLSIRPYLVNAWYAWCCDQGLRPHLTAKLDTFCQAPGGYADKSGHLTLNISPNAVADLVIDKEVRFKARFAGVPQELLFPIGNVVAIFEPETKAGVQFSFIPSEPSTNQTGLPTPPQRPPLTLVK